MKLAFMSMQARPNEERIPIAIPAMRATVTAPRRTQLREMN
jgi:hypothetical protein